MRKPAEEAFLYVGLHWNPDHFEVGATPQIDTVRRSQVKLGVIVPDFGTLTPTGATNLLTRHIECVIVYVMNAKLTLRMDKALIKQAKIEAAQRGKSVSRMFGELVTALEKSKPDNRALLPVTGSLLGVIKGHQISEKDYKQHLQEKHGEDAASTVCDRHN